MVKSDSHAACLGTMAPPIRTSERHDFAASGGAVHDDRAADTDGQPIARLPTMLFRLALSLRRCGATAEADILFSKSSRMLAEEYVYDRLRSGREALRAERAA